MQSQVAQFSERYLATVLGGCPQRHPAASAAEACLVAYGEDPGRRRDQHVVEGRAMVIRAVDHKRKSQTTIRVKRVGQRMGQAGCSRNHRGDRQAGRAVQRGDRGASCGLEIRPASEAQLTATKRVP